MKQVVLCVLAAMLIAASSSAFAQSSKVNSSPASVITNGPVLEYVSSKDAVVAWTSRSGSDMSIKYGTDRSNLSMSDSAAENERGTNHRAKLQNLKPSTTYYFQMMQGGQPVGEIEQFQTVAEGAPPQRQNMNLGVHAGK